MKKLIYLLAAVVLFTSCQKEKTAQKRTFSYQEFTISYDSVVKAYAGSNYSLKIYYTITGAETVNGVDLNRGNLAYTFPVELKNGSGFVYDRIISSRGNETYFFRVLNKSNVYNNLDYFTIYY